MQSLIDEAHTRIAPLVRKTPLEPSFGLDEGPTRVFLKLENMQHTRSFKVRGALNRLMVLNEDEAGRGVVTASTGNHGLAVAFGLAKLGLEGTIYLPETAAPKKVELLKLRGANVSFFGQESAEAEVFARNLGYERGQVYISPYNDPFVVAGQGTIAIELLEQLPELDAVFVPVGGGGLISGIASYLKHVNPSVTVFGCLPQKSPVMFECIRAGRIVAGTIEPTLSDGTAGGVEDGALTFDLCQTYVDEWVLISEEEIKEALRWVFDAHGLVVEGAAGVSIAGCKKTLGRTQHAIRNAAVILCGGNIDMALYRKLVL